MSQKDIAALENIRVELVTRRRDAALGGDADSVIHAQQKLALLDAAILDEQALGQHEKDELAMTRAMKREPDPTNVPEISLLDNPIRVSD
jgi:hypothetical protein